MRRAALPITVWLVLLAGPVNAATVEEPGPTEEWRRLDLQSFDHVWTTIHDRHWDPAMGGLDWEAARDELRPEVESAETTADARAVIHELISRVGLSHYSIIPAEVYDQLALPDGEGALDGSTGIDVRVIDGRAVVVDVVEGSPAAEAGVRAGWVVEKVDEDDLAMAFETVSREFAGTGYEDVALAGVAKGRLVGPVGETVSVEFRDDDDRTRGVELILAEERGRKVRFGYLPPIHVWFDSERIEDTIGYIAFNMFIDPANVMPAFNDAMTAFMDTDGIVIDLRGNPGGTAVMAMGMAGWLIAEKGRYLGTIHTRDNELKVVVFPRPATYAGPVAVLVDGLSGSCSEIFAGGLQDLGRARIFGSRTMGAALPSAIEKLPNGDGFQYAYANYVSRGGEVLEGVGVAPDVDIEPTREGLLRGEDAALDAAIAWIRSQRGR
jgi:carboxyl-terminal processing protease